MLEISLLYFNIDIPLQISSNLLARDCDTVTMVSDLISNSRYLWTWSCSLCLMGRFLLIVWAVLKKRICRIMTEWASPFWCATLAKGGTMFLTYISRNPHLVSWKLRISSGVRSVFKSHIDELEFEPDEFVRSMWVACVVRSGLSASEALGYVGDSAPYSIPEFCTPASVPKWVNKYNLRAFYRLFHEKGLWCRLYNVLIEFPILFTWDTLRTKLY